MKEPDEVQVSKPNPLPPNLPIMCPNCLVPQARSEPTAEFLQGIPFTWARRGENGELEQEVWILRRCAEEDCQIAF